ncbi:S8 family peptidase [Bacillus sp. APMAM]|nr:S8 family peptidase [Bacillus sp. APMAM]RTZ57692.1 peptidase S8/S53 subtilisin kexin sedolisin [Bacillus sp. SAJ1]
MKKLLYSLFVGFLIFSMFTPATKAEKRTDRVIVVFKDKIDKKILDQVNGKIEQSFHNVSAVSVQVPSEDIAALKKNKNVFAVEQDQKLKIAGQFEDWGMKDIKAPTAWKSNYTGKGVKVAVLDSGISKHADLQVAGGVSFTSYTKSYADDNGHGTHVAGIIGAKNNGIGVVGVAPDASLYAVKVLDSKGDGYLSDIISGIDWSIKNHMDVINLSFGTPENSVALQQIVDEAYDKGILVVAAAGNEGNSAGTGNTVDYPAKYSSVIAVGAVDQNNKRGTFSATGPDLEVVAPGVNVLSTYMDNEFAYMSGTSMAAPFVSGTLALLKQANPTLTNIKLREKLDSSVIDLGVKGKDALYGFGLIQAPYLTSTHLNTTKPNDAKTKIPTDKVKAKKDTTTIITTHKKVYSLGSTVWITTKVIDKKTNKPISKAKITLSINSPKGKIKIIHATTNTSGSASFKMTTNRNYQKGNYKLKTKVTKAGYTRGSSVKTIKLY